MLLGQWLQILLYPFRQRSDQVARDGHRWREGDLRIPTNADESHRGRRTALAFLDGVGGFNHCLDAAENLVAMSLGFPDLLLSPRQRRRRRRPSLVSAVCFLVL